MPSDSLSIAAEAERIRRVFAERQEPADGAFDPFRLLAHQERQEKLAAFFRELGLSSLQKLQILDVGCGSGGHLRRLVDFGAEPERCFGMDLFTKRLHDARNLNPNISFAEANAAQLPFGDDQFDLVFQYTVLTSVLDKELRRSIVSEIRRVLRPSGYFVLYDFAYSNPKNPNVRGIGKKELSELLGDFHIRFQRVTLAPPIGRIAGRISPLLYRILASVPLLRTHYLCFARKR
ncbi:MAG TPA: class I SAM-dependent methyltransferase [Candidatus Dormibacteraeota bacterium]|nr:class I SAM-dependent methyltransferase [Candidatus Dormibacteraeota bacterium]